MRDPESALGYAINIIRNYGLDMRSVEIDGRSLADRGICQGPIYREAITDINRRAERDSREHTALIRAIQRRDRVLGDIEATVQRAWELGRIPSDVRDAVMGRAADAGIGDELDDDMPWIVEGE